MDIKTLQERQRWTLEQKIDHAVGTVESFISKTGKTPYVSFSGGKGTWESNPIVWVYEFELVD